MSITDQQALAVQALWRQTFPDATLLPVIGFPSNANGVLTLTHTLGLNKLLKLDRLISISPLSNNALYSAENINGQTLNLYEILIPDIPGVNGEESTAQIYVNALHDQGLSSAGVHLHWSGQAVFNGQPHDHNITAVHHQQYDLSPLEFSQRTINALRITIQAILNRVSDTVPDVPDDTTCCINDRFAEKVTNIWKRSFPDAMLLPVIGFPSNNNNKLAVLTHTMGDDHLMKINGLTSLSALANNALYSFECSRGNFINLYEAMIPDIPGCAEIPSTAQIYMNALRDSGLNVSASHFHWWGSEVYPEDRGVWAIHHEAIDMDPVEFSKKTIKALELTMRAIEKRLGHTNTH